MVNITDPFCRKVWGNIDAANISADSLAASDHVAHTVSSAIYEAMLFALTNRHGGGAVHTLDFEIKGEASTHDGKLTRTVFPMDAAAECGSLAKELHRAKIDATPAAITQRRAQIPPEVFGKSLHVSMLQTCMGGPERLQGLPRSRRGWNGHQHGMQPKRPQLCLQQQRPRWLQPTPLKPAL